MALERSMRRRFLGKMGPFRKVVRLRWIWDECVVLFHVNHVNPINYGLVVQISTAKNYAKRRGKTSPQNISTGHRNTRRSCRWSWETLVSKTPTRRLEHGHVAHVRVLYYIWTGMYNRIWSLWHGMEKRLVDFGCFFCASDIGSFQNGRLCTRDMFSQRRTMRTKIFAQRIFEQW